MSPIRPATGRGPSAALAAVLSAALAASPACGLQQDVDLPAADRRLAAPVPVFTVGGLDVPEWAAFTSVSDAAFDGEGRLYILDPRTPRIVLVDTEGRRVRDVGRAGEGPGEFRIPTGLDTRASGRLLVLDAGTRTWLGWGPDGEPEGTVAPDFSVARPARDFRTDGDDAVIGGPRMLITNGRHGWLSSDGVKEARGAMPILRWPLTDGAEARELHRARMPAWDGAGEPPMMRAFEFRPSWGPLAEGRLAVHDGPEWAVSIVGPDGGAERVLRRPLPARRVTEADRDRERERQRQRVRNGEIMGAAAAGGRAIPPDWEERIRNMHFAERMPAVQRITTDGRGLVFVERRGEEPQAPGPVDVLTAGGRYLGTWPAGAPGLPHAFGPDGLAVWLDEGALGEAIVRVMRLPPPLLEAAGS